MTRPNFDPALRRTQSFSQVEKLLSPRATEEKNIAPATTDGHTHELSSIVGGKLQNVSCTVDLSQVQPGFSQVRAVVSRQFGDVLAAVTKENFQGSPVIDAMPPEQRDQAVRRHVAQTRADLENMIDNIATELATRYSPEQIETAIRNASKLDSVTAVARGSANAAVFNGLGIVADMYGPQFSTWLQGMFRFNESDANTVASALLSTCIAEADALITPTCLKTIFGDEPYYGQVSDEQRLHPAFANFLEHYTAAPSQSLGGRCLKNNLSLTGYHVRNAAAVPLVPALPVLAGGYARTAYDAIGGVAAGSFGETLNLNELRHRYGVEVMFARNDRSDMVGDALRGFDTARCLKGVARLVLGLPVGVLTALCPPVFLPTRLGGRPLEELNTLAKALKPPAVESFSGASLAGAATLGGIFGVNTHVKQKALNEAGSAPYSGGTLARVEAINTLLKGLAYIGYVATAEASSDLLNWANATCCKKRETREERNTKAGALGTVIGGIDKSFDNTTTAATLIEFD